MENTLLKLSQDLLYATKIASDSGSFLEGLAKCAYDDLKKELKTDEQKKTFWINIYNAFIQIRIREQLKQFSKKRFFKDPLIRIAGKDMSFDFIEHGILRRSRIKKSLGYLSNPFPSKIERDLRVDKVDPRIHFALNCGAISCPPIAFYKADQIDAQLDLASQSFLEPDRVYHSGKNEIDISRLFLWYRGDFGGRKGILKFLKNYSIIAPDAFPKLRYKKYDWSLQLNHFTSH